MWEWTVTFTQVNYYPRGFILLAEHGPKPLVSGSRGQTLHLVKMWKAPLWMARQKKNKKKQKETKIKVSVHTWKGDFKNDKNVKNLALDVLTNEVWSEVLCFGGEKKSILRDRKLDNWRKDFRKCDSNKNPTESSNEHWLFQWQSVRCFTLEA